MFSVQFVVYLNFTQFDFHLILFNLKIGFQIEKGNKREPAGGGGGGMPLLDPGKI